MKLITAIIRPGMLERLASALRKAQVPGMTAVEVKGFGRETLSADWDLSGFLTTKMKVQIAVDDSQTDAVVSLIKNTVSTGKHGDGIIFVTDVISAIRISSGEENIT